MSAIAAWLKRRWPRIDNRPWVQKHYEHCRSQGTPARLAEMFALQAPPASNSDVEFLRGRGGCYAQFDGNPWMETLYRKRSEALGQDTTGKVYLSSLARFPGDPLAWVSGRGDVQKVCEANGWGASGSVNVKGDERNLTDEKPYRVADDLVAAKAERMVAANPDLAHKPQRDLLDEAREKISPSWDNVSR